MFAKIFASIFDSSIADDWQLRLVFQDMLVLADKDGIVDMTPQAISRRTNVPLEIVLDRLRLLENDDPMSRTPAENGRRIIRLDPHRDWGWQIVNYLKYRESATKEMLRMADADRKRAYRERFKKVSPRAPLPKTVQEGEEEMSHMRPEMSRTAGDSEPASPATSCEVGHQIPPFAAAQKGKGISPSTQAILDQKALDRIEKRMAMLKERNQGSSDWPEKDSHEWKKLKSKKETLVKSLGFDI